MTRLLRCAKGHQWPDTFLPEETTAQLSSSCPVCGSAVLVDTKEPVKDIATQEMTLGEHSNLAASVRSATEQVEYTLDPSEKTAPTIAAAQVDDATTIMPGQAPPRRDPSGQTLPLSLSQESLRDQTVTEENDQNSDRTEVDDDSDRTASDDELELTEADGEAGDESQTKVEDRGSSGQPPDQTEATAFGKPTNLPQRPGSQTGKRLPLGATRVRKVRPGKDAKLPAQIAGYEILGELGRGGMGVVYKARQAGLNRLCALKMILGGGLASADTIARFKVEAAAIAHLQHPNIVQVYETGEANGSPYFSLEFVDGSNLQTKIGATPQPALETARLMIQICAGVNAAHQRGVLHRDLKPANVLMTRDNVPKITDFGLAKRLEEKDVGQTRSGAILGTPSYMAPEQAMGRAKDVGPAADIYSLGAVMYDMITGRPPFKGETVMDTLNQVQKLEPLPPARLAPKVPLDLQTICLKALQKDPKKRYETAGAMGEDLRRFLAGEPILARPTPHWERAVKWVKRRPAIATMIGVGALMVISILTFAALWQESRIMAEAKLKTQAKLNEKTEKDLRHKAEVALDKEAEAFDLTFLAEDGTVKIGSVLLHNLPGAEKVRKELLEKAKELNLKILQASNFDDSKSRYRTVKVSRLVGYINKELGNYEDALTAYAAALAGSTDLLMKFPNDETFLLSQAACTIQQAELLQLLKRLPESEKEFRKAIPMLGNLVEKFPKDLLPQEDLATAYQGLASLCFEQGRLEEAETNYDLAMGMRTDAIAKGQNDELSRFRLAQLQRNRAVLLLQLNKAREAEKSLLASRDIFADLVKASPKVPDYASELALSWKQLANCYSEHEPKRLALAADALRKAAQLLEELRGKFSNTPIYKLDLARVHYELGLIFGQQGQLPDARDELTRAADLMDGVLREQPGRADVQFELGQCCNALGIAQVGLNNLEEGRKQYRKGIDLLEALHPVAATMPAICSELATGHQNLAMLLTALKESPEADKSWGRMLSLREDLVKAFPQSRDYRKTLAETHITFAQRYQKTGKDTEAAIQWKQVALQFGECMVLAAKDPLMSAEARKSYLDACGKDAMEALNRAVKLGFNDVSFLKTAPELQLLREWPEFGGLVNQLETKSGKKI